MKPTRLYLCEGYDPLFGPIRDTIEAAGFGDAKTKFFHLHGIQATHKTMIDLTDPQSVCRSLGYFMQYLGTMAPLVGLAWLTWRIAR